MSNEAEPKDKEGLLDRIVRWLAKHILGEEWSK